MARDPCISQIHHSYSRIKLLVAWDKYFLNPSSRALPPTIGTVPRWVIIDGNENLILPPINLDILIGSTHIHRTVCELPECVTLTQPPIFQY